MKSLKKTLVLLVVFSMILSTLVPAFAATDVIGLDCEDQVTRMEALGIIEGFEDGTFRPDETITRAQMAVVICKMVGINEAAAKANANVSSKFSDVAAGEWYTGWVNLASNNGIISGYPDGTFRPNQTLTLNEVLTLCVKALGRGGYVDKMGTWPANYVTEAARLNLLKDVKGASDANRGTVAVIAWNTLNAATWYVNSENLDGEVALGHDSRSLLAINFDEYTDVYGDLKEVEEVEVLKTPARDITIGERQIVLAGLGNTTTNNGVTSYIYDFDFETSPKKATKETTTYIKGSDVVAYVPEEVCADLDALYGREVTVIFGDDNEVALIMITSDTVDGVFAEEYDSTEDEITIAGETYEFSDDVTAEIYVNGKKVTNGMTGISSLLNGDEFTKKVGASFILDEDGDIKRLDLTVSGTYPEFNTREAVVTKNSKDVITYYYMNNTSWSKDTYDYEDELEDDKLPRVTIDGATGSIEDIEAGNVITMVYGKDTNDIVSIYVATETVSGEITRLKKDGKRIYVDGEEYVASMDKLFVTEDEVKDATDESINWATVLEKEDTVTLYTNIYGEYVLVATENAGVSEWEFAYVRGIKDVEENDNEEFVATLKLLLADGTKTSAYKVVIDSDDWTGKFSTFEDYIRNQGSGDKIDIIEEAIAFKANSDNEIVLESLAKVGDVLRVVTSGAKFGKLEAVTIEGGTTENDATLADDKRDTIGSYDFNKDTVIFDLAEEKILSKYNSIVAKSTASDVSRNGKKVLAKDALAVVENSALKYMFFTASPTVTSDEVYAIYKNVDGENVELFNGEDVTLEHANKEDEIDALAKNSFVEYTLNSKDEVNGMKQLIDIDAFRAEESKANIVVGTAANTLKVNLPTIKNVKVEAKVGKGQYTRHSIEDEGNTVVLYGDADANEYIYIHELKPTLDSGKTYTVVFNNPALTTAGYESILNEDGYLVKLHPGANRLFVLLENDQNTIASIYEGDVRTSYEDEVPVIVYNFNDVNVVEDTTNANTFTGDVTETNAFVKDIFAVKGTEKLRFTYADSLENEAGFNTLGTIAVDEDTVVYDLRDGFVVEDFDYFTAEAEKETLYVVPFANAEAETSNILVIVE